MLSQVKTSRFATLLSMLLLMGLLVSGPASAGTLPAPARFLDPAAPHTPIGNAFTYEGQITLAGSPVSGECDLSFGLWSAPSFDGPDAPTAPVAIEEVSSVTLDKGWFAVSLDYGPGIFTGESKWMEIRVRCPAGVGTYVTLAPRQEMTAMPYALYARTSDWDGLLNTPAGFADGVDDGSVYTAGVGLTLTNGTFAIDAAAIQTRVSGACNVGAYIRAVAADGTVTCGTDADTTYQAGDGLTLNSNTFGVDASVVQVRVTGTCAAGQYITSVALDGTVTCGPDADTDTTYTAGNGLVLTGTVFSADASLARVSDITATVAAGDFLTRTLADTLFTYLAGDGLTLNSNTFGVDASVVQARVTGTCSVGSYVTGINGDGTVTCGAPALYVAGDGLTLSGTVFAASPTLARLSDITPTVAAGNFLTRTLADTLFTYLAGDGLLLSGNRFAVDTSTVQARVSGTCAVGQYITAIAANGAVTCGTDADTNTTYTAGSGLVLTGTLFSVVTNTVQARVSSACAVGFSIRAINADGTVTCQADTNSGGTITSVGVGTGLAGGGASGAVTVTLASGYQLPQSCASGQVPVSNGAGGWVCGANDATPTNIVAFFMGTSCPTGWSEVVALRGRAVVGLPASGTLSGTVGTALTNVQTRTVTLTTSNLPAHTHDVDPVVFTATTSTSNTHNHSVSDGGTGFFTGLTANGFAHSHTVAVDVPNTTSTSTGGGTAFDVTLPYLQLLACTKN